MAEPTHLSTVFHRMCLACLAGVCVACGLRAQAVAGESGDSGQDGVAGQPVVELGDFVVTGTREGAEAQHLPSSVQVITADDIAQSGAGSVVDVLSRLGGLYFRSYSGNPTQAQVDMRGFGENGHLRTLVLVDGHRLNRPDMAGINWLDIPLADVERIEIVRGAHSALYGNNAVGGVINVITKRGKAKESSPRTTVSSQIGSDEMANHRVSVSGREGRLGYSANLDLNDTEGYRDNSAYYAKSGSLSLSYDISEHVTASGSVSLVRTDYQLPGGLSAIQLRDDRKQARPTSLGDGGLDRSLTFSGGLDVDLVDFGHLSLDGSVRDSKLQWDLGGTHGFNDIRTLAFTPSYSVELPGFFEDSHRLTLGADLYRDTLDFHAKEDWGPGTRGTIKASLQRDTWGVYLEEEWTLREDLIFTGVVRHEHTSFDAGFRHLLNLEDPYSRSTSSDEEAYSLGLTWLPTDPLRCFVRWERLFRLPTTDEIAFYQGAGSGFNDDLQAETGQTLDLGFELRPSSDLMVGMTFFQTVMDGEIIFDGVRNTNLQDRTQREGIETMVRWSPRTWLRLRGNYTYVRAKFAGGENDGRDVQLVPRQVVSGGIDVSLPFSLTVQADVMAAASCYQGTGDTGYAQPRLPGYAVCDVALHYRPEWEIPITGLDMFVGVDNVLNKEYVSLAVNGAYYPALERVVKAGVSFEF